MGMSLVEISNNKSEIFKDPIVEINKLQMIMGEKFFEFSSNSQHVFQISKNIPLNITSDENSKGKIFFNNFTQKLDFLGNSDACIDMFLEPFIVNGMVDTTNVLYLEIFEDQDSSKNITRVAEIKFSDKDNKFISLISNQKHISTTLSDIIQKTTHILNKFNRKIFSN